MDGPYSNGVEEKDMKDEAHRLCKEFLGGAWSTVSQEDFIFTVVSGGFSNKLYLCRLPEKTKSKNPKIPNEVLFRIYGFLQEENAHIIVAEAATFMLLSERNLGPKLYGVFPKGRLEEYIPSRILSTKDIRRFSKTIAKEMANIHALQVPIRKVPDMVPFYFKNWLDVIEKSSPTNSQVMSLIDKYEKEMKWLRSQMELVESPVVFCHNDLQGGNILVREGTEENEEPELILIDFEFGTYNYRGFDLGNHFSEWCFDYNTEVYPYFTPNFDNYPTESEQIEFIETYLKQLKKLGALDENASIHDDTLNIMKEAMIYRLASHLLWSIWSYKTGLSSSLGYGFAHSKYSEARFQLYLKQKEELLNAEFYSRSNTNGQSS